MSTSAEFPAGCESFMVGPVPVASQQLQADPAPKLVEFTQNAAETHPIEALGSPTVPPVEKTRIWGLSFARLTMEETLEQIDELIQRREPSQIITANLNFLMLCEGNRELVGIAERASLILCDGMPIWARSRLSKHPLPERVAGSDLIYRLSERAAKRGYRIFFLGAAEGIAQQTADRLCQLYPGLQVAGVECPPFTAWSETYLAELKDRIRTSKPDLLLVAFGQPKGESWIEQHLRDLQVPVSIQLGASFDFVAGTAKRAPRVYQCLGLEWLYRMSHDPKRLIPRYFRNALCLARWLIRDMMGTR